MTHNHKQQPRDAREESDSPSQAKVYAAAKSYVRSGLSLIPICADASKRPAFELLPRVWSEDEQRYRRPWSEYKQRRPTPEELREWFEEGYLDREYGMAIVGGAVSGNLEIIDCDSWDVAEQWSELVEAHRPGLLHRLVRVRSPRPGMHVYFRCSDFGGNQKLARVAEVDSETGKPKPKTIIEVKGEAGYCVAPPSPAKCHKTGKCYTFLTDKDLTHIKTITPDERATLFECAKLLNTWAVPERTGYMRRPAPTTNDQSLRPGDDFDLRADWADILTPHGWKWVGRGGEGADLWCRPDKEQGTSATTNYAGSDLLHMFSTNGDPFEEDKSYTKFHAYTLLNWKGAFIAAASALAAQGYGGRRRHRGDSIDVPFARYATYTTRSKKNT